jgi:2-polyprenyl-3-methyl-5-hydroxy-6-metoxy-1,4-benzoquinol methylase
MEPRSWPAPRAGVLWAAAWTAIPEGVATRLEAGGAALEIGCGRGLACIALAEQFPAARVIGHDVDEEAIAHAEVLAGVSGLAPRVRFAVADSMHLPRSTFDLVAVWEVLIRPADPRRLLNAIRNALVPDGICLSFETPSVDALQTLALAAGFSRCRPRSEKGHPHLFELSR